MFGTRYARSVRIAACLIGLLMCAAVTPSHALAANGKEPILLHLHWKQIAAGPTVVVTDNNEVAIQTCDNLAIYACVSQVSVFDEQTGDGRELDPPSSCGTDATPDSFGGPYLLVGCTEGSHMLYDLDTGQWLPITPKCPATCAVVGVGRYWVKLSSVPCDNHCPTSYFLQDIQTGDAKRDPVKAGGRTWDDLSAPAGTAPLCAPLRYPTSDYPNVASATPTPEPGSLQFDGAYALATGATDTVKTALVTTYRLDHCGSRATLNVTDADANEPPFISSRAIVTLGRRLGTCPRSDRYGNGGCAINISIPYVKGFYLHGLRPFTAAMPNVTVSLYGSRGEVVGLTDDAILITAPAGGPLWEATLPREAR